MPNAKPILPPLKTPKSATFPSELHDVSPSSVSDSIKKEDSCTPLTPNSSIPLPKAYTEFLEALTPVFSPASAGASFHKFPLIDKPSASPTSQPASALSGSFAFSPSVRSPTVSLPPPTPGSAAPSKKGFPAPRRLRIPHSLKYSPTTDSPKSATPLRSPFSASDWKFRYHDPPRSATGKPVSVKQIVTQTVTYKRTQLDAPPKGKRRKCREVKEIKESKEFKESKEA
ncbi:uncharacterized protein N7459_005707 [Penicillium hispanicum]|uniref:uncharacterized protein n=1 Tax=Penicillium hispanicum TaxID=1080232 RepID=UPI002540ED64|nr:uncharacterized protein N7459_005707 [Penicillium hispanicum]KAJ5579722.1 hypothetical protein N7459_005707 [Penicillium hispanicum]